MKRILLACVVAAESSTAAAQLYTFPASPMTVADCPAGKMWIMKNNLPTCDYPAPPPPPPPPPPPQPLPNTVTFVLVAGGFASGGGVPVPAATPYAYSYTSRQGFGGSNVEYVLFGSVPYDQLKASGGYAALTSTLVTVRNPGASTVVNGWVITHGTPSMQFQAVTGPGFDSALTGGGSNGPGTCFTWTYLAPASVCNNGATVQ